MSTFTIVIDLHSSASRLDPAMPFLYSLIGEGLIKIIYCEKNSSNYLTSFDKYIADVYIELKRKGFPEWQVIFLTDISNEISDKSNLFFYCLSEQLACIKKNFFNILNQKECGLPARSFVIATDYLEMDASLRDKSTGEPTTLRPRIIWEIDTRGYVTTDSCSQAYIFKESEINEIDEHFPQDINFKHENINDGLDGIKNEDLKNKIINGCENISTFLKKLVNKKKAEIEKLVSEDTIQLAKTSLLDELLNGFTKELAEIKKKPFQFEKMKPSVLLKKHISECFSVISTKHERIMCLRFPFQRSLVSSDIAEDRRWNVIKLGYFLISIVEQGKIIFRDPTGIHDINIESNRFWCINDIQIDYNELEKIFLKYRRNLSEVLKETDLQKKHLHVTVPVMNSDCGCSEGKPLSEPERRPYRNFNSHSDFKFWVANVNSDISDFCLSATQRLDQCSKDLMSNVVQSQTEDIKDIGKEYENCENSIKKLKKRLLDKTYENIDNTWLDSISEINRQIVDIIICRPNVRQRVLSFAAIAFIMCVPYLLTISTNPGVIDYSSPAIIIPVIIMCFLCFMVIAVLLFIEKFKLMRLLEKAEERAKSILTNIKEKYERNKEYIEIFCKLGIAVKNHRAFDAGREKAKLNIGKMEYHQTEMNKHLKYSKGLFPNSREPLEVDKVKPSGKIDYDIPREKSSVYNPARAADDLTSYELKTDASGTVKLKSELLPALKKIEIVEDFVYQRVD